MVAETHDYLLLSLDQEAERGQELEQDCKPQGLPPTGPLSQLLYNGCDKTL